MSSDKKHCKTLITKLAGLPGFPRDYPSAVTALIEILADRARDDQHASHVIASLLETAERCPVVSDLIRLCHESAAQFGKLEDRGCPQCVGGYRRAWFLTTKNTGRRWTHERITQERARELEPKLDLRQQSITEAADRCACIGGRA